jgi:membrane protease YdiL (CAAX protease family)
LFAAAYPLGNFLFVFIAAMITFYFSKHKPIENLKFNYPGVQLILIVFVITFVFFLLLNQYPDSEVAKNPVTILVVSINARTTSILTEPLLNVLKYTGIKGEILDNFNVGLTNTICYVLIPLFFLIPLARKRQDYAFKSFDWRLMICLFLLYAPFLLWKEYSFSFLTAYFAAYLFIGFSEEFLFRSLLQIRLESFFNNKLNAIVLASIIFGIIHIPINTKMYGWPVNLAFCIGVNAFGGLLNGYILYRTRSIWLVALLHAWSGTVLTMK